MTNSVLAKDTERLINSTKIEQEYSPGHGRRVEPESGVKKHNERIHKESNYAKDHKNLPFSFRKPPKPVGRPEIIVCPKCGHVFSGSDKTVCFICSGCKEFIKIGG
jgi:rubrerythrin